MSGGSSDDACLAVAHAVEGRALLDVVVNQGPAPPFDPRAAVKRFAGIVRSYGLSRVRGDAYAGQTFRSDFEREGITYLVADETTSAHHEALEPKINGGEVELLDVPALVEQLTGLVMKGGKVTHASGDHDDFACAATGALFEAVGRGDDSGITFGNSASVVDVSRFCYVCRGTNVVGGRDALGSLAQPCPACRAGTMTDGALRTANSR